MESASSPLAPTSTRGGGDNGAGALLSWDLWAAENWAAAASSNPTAASHYHNSTHPCYHYHGQHGVTCAYAPPQPLPFTDCQHQQELARYHYAGTNGGYSTAADLAHHHLTCLKLGKRHYYEEAGRAPVEAPAVAPAAGKKATAAASPPLVSSSSSSSSAVTSSTAAVVPKCQVEGCNARLTDAKDYHKRHKVCETHSKAPKVVVLGLEQRFCQQCSRFHVISEFDDAKRSCRRRLAGHNERRRKSSNEAIVRNTSFDYISAMGGRFPYIPSSTSSPGRALSLLSTESSAWSHSELSSQSSAALRELIAENRAALLARQLFLDRDCHGAAASVQDNHFHQQVSCYPHLLPAGVPTQLPMGWDNFRDVGSHVTLDLMQVPNSSYEALSPRRSKSNSKEDDEENCCGIWKSLAGTHVV